MTTQMRTSALSWFMLNFNVFFTIELLQLASISSKFLGEHVLGQELLQRSNVGVNVDLNICDNLEIVAQYFFLKIPSQQACPS